MNDINFVNESHLFTLSRTIAKTYTTTAREPSIYPDEPFILTDNFFIKNFEGLILQYTDDQNKMIFRLGSNKTDNMTDFSAFLRGGGETGPCK